MLSSQSSAYSKIWAINLCETGSLRCHRQERIKKREREGGNKKEGRKEGREGGREGGRCRKGWG
jgi:hypothetical protein